MHKLVSVIIESLRKFWLTISLFAATHEAFCQQDQTAQFELASVKRVPADSVGKFTCTRSPIRFACPKATLQMLAADAYSVLFTQVVGLAWTKEAAYAYEVEATMPPNTTREQFRLMLQSLLRDRFHLVAHREQRETKVLALRVGKDGPNFKPSIETAARPDDPANMQRTNRMRHWHLDAKRQSMEAFSRYLTIPTGTKVLDETGLTGAFDFSLDFTPEMLGTLSADPGAEDHQETAPGIYTAIKSLGLKLEPTKAPIEFLVIDAADQIPTEN